VVGRNLFRACLVVAVIVGARPAAADAIKFTGNVTNDFSPANNPNAQIITNPADQSIVSSTGPNGTTLLNNLAPGIFLKDVALDYNAATDTMYVGIQTYGVAGSVDGSTIGSGNGMVVGFVPVTSTSANPGLQAPTFVAGDSNVPLGASPTAAGRGPGLDGFNVAKYAGGTVSGTINLLTGFGQTLTAGLGNLAFTPSTATPDYEFTIKNFSKLLGANPGHDVLVMVQDGQDNANSGKGGFIVNYFPVTTEPQTIPEPTTWMLWAGMAAGMAWRYRRSRRSRS
jgi:hypothetical protein